MVTTPKSLKVYKCISVFPEGSAASFALKFAVDQLADSSTLLVNL